LSFDNFDFDGWVFMDRPFLFHWKEERAAATDESWLRDCCHFRIGSFHSSDTQRAPHVFSSFFLSRFHIDSFARHTRDTFFVPPSVCLSYMCISIKYFGRSSFVPKLKETLVSALFSSFNWCI
jgi:hypothetical protein